MKLDIVRVNYYKLKKFDIYFLHIEVTVNLQTTHISPYLLSNYSILSVLFIGEVTIFWA